MNGFTNGVVAWMPRNDSFPRKLAGHPLPAHAIFFNGLNVLKP
ncbi:MAG: hypothetical protein V7771_13150 [Shewanella psychromarinicola]